MEDVLQEDVDEISSAMKSRHDSLIDLAKPIQPLLGSVILDIERSLSADYYVDVDAAESRWYEEHADAVVSNLFYGRVLKLTSQTAFSASSNAMKLSTGNFARSECNVLYVSRTLNIGNLACRLMAQASGIDVGKMSSGRLSDSEWDKLEIALGQIDAQQFFTIHTQQIEIPLLHDWLRYASSNLDATPLVVIDDALLLPINRCRSKNGGQRDLLELSRIASSVDALIVLVDQTWAH